MQDNDNVVIQIIKMLVDFKFIQAMIATSATIGIIVLYVSGKSVPTELFSIIMVIIGYYFGMNTNNHVKSAIEEVKSSIGEYTSAKSTDKTI